MGDKDIEAGADDGKPAEDEGSGGMSESTRNVLIAIGALIGYLVIGVLMYTLVLEEWTTVDALYFSIVTVTTVGYGDICPSTTASKMFTSFFAFVGVAQIGVALGVIATFVIEKQEKALQDAKKLAAAKMEADMAAAEAEEASGKGPPKNKAAAEKAEKDKAAADAQRAKLEALSAKMGTPNPVYVKMLKAFLPILIIVLLIALFEGPYEEWSFIDSIYFAVITSTTIGYGDLSPQKPLDRGFAIVYIPIAVIAVGNALGQIADIYVDQQMQESNKKLLGKEISIEELLKMDKSGDAKVDEYEFTCFMLRAMKKADEELLDEIDRQFKALDSDGSGVLDWNDIMAGQKKASEE